jgi:hypothetical protein
VHLVGDIYQPRHVTTATTASPTKDAYVVTRVKFALERLTKTATRLSVVLNAIKWESD